MKEYLIKRSGARNSSGKMPDVTHWQSRCPSVRPPDALEAVVGLPRRNEPCVELFTSQWRYGATGQVVLAGTLRSVVPEAAGSVTAARWSFNRRVALM